eukprot:jgi/Orpsp1_1/1174271/evm.model.c7180000049477.1
MHHIICDGTTISIIKKELNKYYENDKIEELEVQFSDYALYVEDKKINGLYENQFKFYQDMFNDSYNPLILPQKEEILNCNNDIMKKRSKIITRLINKEQSRKIEKYLKKNNVSKTSFFLSIYGYILSKYSGQESIYTSIVSANRNSYYTENMIGMFVSTQPILLKYGEKDISLSDIINNNMNKLIEIYNNQEISFFELVSRLKLERVNNTFIFQAKEIINENENSSIFDEYVKDFYTLMDCYSDELMEENNKEAKFDITFNVEEREEDYLILVEYNETLYEEIMISRILDSYIEVIKNMELFEEYIYNIEFIPEEEKEKIIKEFNSESDRNECENYYFEKFQEMAENGVSRNDIIPIICDRTPYHIISTIAISKSGGAFLPIDIKLPIDRIKFILQEVKPKIILHCNSDKIIENLNDCNYKFYNLKEHSYDKWQNKLENINQPDDTCYVLFTSGTTGKPKGVLISHFNIYNYIRSFEEDENNYSLHNLLIRKDCINNALVLTNFTFDISHDEITLCLMHGLTMILADEIT